DGTLALGLPVAVRPVLSRLDIARTEAAATDLPAVTVVASERRVLRTEVSGTLGPAVEGGPGRVTLALPPLAPGRWRVAVDGAPQAGAVPLLVLVSAPSSAPVMALPPSAGPDGGRPWWRVPVLIVAIGLGVVAGAFLVVRRRA